jgi:hypothetical protein
MPTRSEPELPSSARAATAVAALLLCLLAAVTLAQPPPEEAPPAPTPPPTDGIEEQIERQEQAIEEALRQVEEDVRRDLRRDLRRRGRGGSDTKVSIGSSVRVEEDRIAENVVAIGGGIKVDGEVLGDAVAIMGTVKISGRVTGDVVAVLGGVELGAEAEVLGDVVSVGGRVERESGATVLGSVSEVAFAPDFEWGPGEWWPAFHFDDDWHPFRFFDYMELVWALLGVLLLVLVVSLVLLVAPTAVGRVEAEVRAEPWKSGLVGLALQVFFLPVLVLVCVILAISIIGIPLLLLVPFVVLAFLIAALLGYTGSALVVGRAIDARFHLRQTSPYLILLLGVALIQSLSLFGDLLDLGGGFLWLFAITFGLFGFLVRYLAWTVGLGAVFLTRFGTLSPVPIGTGAALPPPPPLGEGPDEPEHDEGDEGLRSSSYLAGEESGESGSEPASGEEERDDRNG